MEIKSIYKCKICGRYVEKPFHCGREAEELLDSKKRLWLSKLLSLLLRHEPWRAGLRIDRSGWVNLDELVSGIRSLNSSLSWVTREHIIALATLDPKGRFEVSDNKIRARYGHSIKVIIERDLQEDVESKILYHGTLAEKVEKIMREGILPMKRRFVHLTTSYREAVETASRRGRKIAIIVVDAECLRARGMKIMVAGRNVRVTRRVPPECIRRAEIPQNTLQPAS